MRNLTITRSSAFLGKLSSYKVYVEDRRAKNYIEIAGHKCCFLGTIKDGETKTFEITNDKVRIFVINDKITKNLCNDLYTLPAGSEDVILSGKAKFNCISLHAFCFDGTPSRDMARNRKKNTKASAILLSLIVAVLLILGFVVGFIVDDLTVTPPDFAYKNMRITLTESFKEQEVEGTEFYFSDGTVSVFGERKTLDDDPTIQGLSLKDFADISLFNQNLKVELVGRENYYYFTYDKTVSNKQNISFYGMFFKDGDDFWFLTFSCPLSQKDELNDDIFAYADSVYFK